MLKKNVEKTRFALLTEKESKDKFKDQDPKDLTLELYIHVSSFQVSVFNLFSNIHS